MQTSLKRYDSKYEQKKIVQPDIMWSVYYTINPDCSRWKMTNFVQMAEEV